MNLPKIIRNPRKGPGKKHGSIKIVFRVFKIFQKKSTSESLKNNQKIFGQDPPRKTL